MLVESVKEGVTINPLAARSVFWELNAPSASEEPAGIDGAGAGVAVPGLDGAAGAGAAWPVGPPPETVTLMSNWPSRSSRVSGRRMSCWCSLFGK